MTKKLQISAPLPPEIAARYIRLPRYRQRALATKLLSFYPKSPKADISETPIKIVCISDTHTTQPDLPDGDLLLHAGDLSEKGSLSEIQAQLTWLSSQPHKYKVIIAGNHDVLLDRGFLSKYPEWDHDPGASPADLDFGSVKYLQDESVILDFSDHGGQKLKIYGSPITPEYGVSAFQVPRGQDVWTGAVPVDTDILLTHGPPYGHLDGVRHAGSQHLAQEVARTRPRLVVFGHIHVGHGREDVQFHAVRRAYEGVQGGWRAWAAVMEMCVRVLWERVLFLVMPPGARRQEKTTTLVNAAVLGGGKHEYLRPAITVYL